MSQHSMSMTDRGGFPSFCLRGSWRGSNSSAGTSTISSSSERCCGRGPSNVVGTLTVFEAAKSCGDQVRCVVYASSGAVLGAIDEEAARPLPDDAPRLPGTLYSVFKAALLGQACQIGFSGPANAEYADDVARCFVACALKAPAGAPVCNMLGEVLTVEDMIGVIEELFPSARGTISCLPQRNAMVNEVSDAGLQALIGPLRPVSCREGARRTAEHFRSLLAEGRRCE